MAKVNGPLFSITAHGSIGNELTYSQRRNSNQVRFQKKQNDFFSDARDTQRIRFGIASRVWANLSSADKQALAALL